MGARPLPPARRRGLPICMLKGGGSIGGWHCIDNRCLPLAFCTCRRVNALEHPLIFPAGVERVGSPSSLAPYLGMMNTSSYPSGYMCAFCLIKSVLGHQIRDIAKNI